MRPFAPALPLLLLQLSIAAAPQADVILSDWPSARLPRSAAAGMIAGQAAGPAAVSHPLSLSLRVTVEPSWVHLHYVVKSREARVVYLLNRLHRGTPESIDPNLCYVDFEPRSRTVIVSKRVPDLPTDRSVYQPVAPYVSRLSPGGEFAEGVTLAVPIGERREYEAADRRPLARREYTSLRLRLGYYVAPDGTREEFEQTAGRRILMPRVPPGTRPEFGELTAAQGGLSLPVLALAEKQ